MIGWAQSELTLSKRQKTCPGQPAEQLSYSDLRCHDSHVTSLLCHFIFQSSFPFFSLAVPSTPSYPGGPLHLRPICQRFLTTQVDFPSLRVLDSIDLWQRLVQSTEKPTVTSSDKQLGWSLGYHWHCRWPSANLASEFAQPSLWVQASCRAFHLGTSCCWKLTLIPAWISNHMPSKRWDESTYPLPNFNCTIEVWEWISNSISHFIMDVITYPCWD